jgi:hypothetical protein
LGAAQHFVLLTSRQTAPTRRTSTTSERGRQLAALIHLAPDLFYDLPQVAHIIEKRPERRDFESTPLLLSTKHGRWKFGLATRKLLRVSHVFQSGGSQEDLGSQWHLWDLEFTPGVCKVQISCRCQFNTLEGNRLMRCGRSFVRPTGRLGRHPASVIMLQQILLAGMSFQITILKVLAGHPEGRASLAELRRAVAILISSGPDWTDRTKRLAARAPELDIFSQSFVLRHSDGWQITDAGRAFLISVERPAPLMASSDQAVAGTPIPASTPIRLGSPSRRRSRRWAGDRMRPSAA